MPLVFVQVFIKFIETVREGNVVCIPNLVNNSAVTCRQYSTTKI